jgi:parallel beta-helix repeat protein
VLPAGGDVQQAIDALPAGPATLCLGAGEFKLHRLVAIERDDVVLRGAGRATVLRLDHGRESPVLVVGDHRRREPAHPVADVRIESLRVVGGGWKGREADREHPYLMNSAVAVRAGRGVVVRGLELAGCRSACILTEHDSRDVTIADNVARGAYWDGISLNDTRGARVTGNVVRANKAAGITAEHLEDSRIEGNTLADNGSAGIYLANSRRNVVAANRIAGNRQAGVFLTCAVIQNRRPARCFPDTMSEANVFERNELAGNRRGYVLAPNVRADCRRPGFVANVSREDRVVPPRNDEPDPRRFGRCLDRAARRMGGARAARAGGPALARATRYWRTTWPRPSVNFFTPVSPRAARIAFTSSLVTAIVVDDAPPSVPMNAPVTPEMPSWNWP